MIALFTDARCLRHQTPPGYPEVPARLEAVLAACRAAGYRIADRGEHEGALEAVLRIHPERYVRRFERAVLDGARLIDTSDNPLSPGTWDAAWGAVSAALHAVEHACGGGESAFALVRPPGHHAEREQAMGFCYFNNVAVAAAHAQTLGIERVAVLDFDVHHGNGTQHLFYDRGDIFYASVHQFPFYPGTGRREERGVGAGLGATLNEPLPGQSGDDAYELVWQGSLLPALTEFAPGVLLVSAGFDAWRLDPVGGMQVSEAGFREWGVWLGSWAARQGVPLVGVLEGGYDLARLPSLVLGHLGGLEEGLDAGPD